MLLAAAMLQPASSNTGGTYINFMFHFIIALFSTWHYSLLSKVNFIYIVIALIFREIISE
jgi:hypothetical protein